MSATFRGVAFAIAMRDSGCLERRLLVRILSLLVGLVVGESRDGDPGASNVHDISLFACMCESGVSGGR